MVDDIVPKRLYSVKLLNDDIQKQDNGSFVVENVKISPAGVLEADRVWQDVEFTTKIFYNGQFYVVELGPDEVEEWFNPHDCEHDGDK